MDDRKIAVGLSDRADGAARDRERLSPCWTKLEVLPVQGEKLAAKALVVGKSNAMNGAAKTRSAREFGKAYMMQLVEGQRGLLSRRDELEAVPHHAEFAGHVTSIGQKGFLRARGSKQEEDEQEHQTANLVHGASRELA